MFTQVFVNAIYEWEEIVTEGLAKIIIPKRELFQRPDQTYEPAWSPVFYNPLMKPCRDLTVLVNYSYFGNKSYFFIDSLAGTGVRGIRLGLETNGYGIINDVDPIAYYYMLRNIELNNLSQRVQPYMCESNALFNNFTFSGVIVDYIDIDPYGSPIPFIDSAVKTLGKNSLLGVTATDTAPLVCSHRHKTLRRYNIECMKTDFEKELGLRILIYNLIIRSASQDVCLKPLISYYHKHYYRVFFETTRSGSKAFENVSKCRGYLWYCPKTLERGFVKEINTIENNCSDGEQIVAGPLWICNLGDTDFLKKLIDNVEKFANYIDLNLLKQLKILLYEYRIEQPYIRYDKFFSKIGRNMIPIEEFINIIKKQGFEASRSHFDPRGVRTNAPVKILREIFS